MPVLVVPDIDDRLRRGHPDPLVLHAFTPELSVAYSLGPPWGEPLLTRSVLDRLGTTRTALRRHAAANLDGMLRRVRVCGQPPALMLSFDGLESSLLLADSFWPALQRMVPGELVVGVPARDAVIVTGSQSRTGLAKVRRAVDRLLLAGGPNLLLRELLVLRRDGWHVFGDEAAAPPSWAAADRARAAAVHQRERVHRDRAAASERRGRPHHDHASAYEDHPLRDRGYQGGYEGAGRARVPGRRGAR